MTDFSHAASQFIADHRLWGAALIGLIAFGESMLVVGAFLPATVMLVAAGGLIAAGLLDAGPVLLLAILGAVAGDAMSYLIGRRIGPRLLRHRGLKRHRRAIARTRLLIRRRGGLTLVIGRFAGPLRAFVPVMAGMMGMPEQRFQLANVASGLIWVAAFVGPGYATTRGLTLLSHQTVSLLAAVATIAVMAGGLVLGFKPLMKRSSATLAASSKVLRAWASGQNAPLAASRF